MINTKNREYRDPRLTYTQNHKMSKEGKRFDFSDAEVLGFENSNLARSQDVLRVVRRSHIRFSDQISRSSLALSPTRLSLDIETNSAPHIHVLREESDDIETTRKQQQKREDNLEMTKISGYSKICLKDGAL